MSEKLFAIAGLSERRAIAGISTSRLFARFVEEAENGEFPNLDVLDGDGTTEKNTLYEITHRNRAG